jgi:anti-sigma factor RsiW
MEHNDIRHRLSEYIDNSVTAEEKAAIEAHLKTCTQCREALSELRKTIEHIKTVEDIDPPAWMTQKIMATVRAEVGEKKSLFQRLFYPLAVKIPIQAIAVLFLAVTGFYIYQNIQPAERTSEAPSQEFAAKKPVAPTDTAQDKLAKADRPALRSKQFPQTPAYKALDMKQEYEKPPQPTLQGQATAPPPAPAVPAMPAEQPMPAKKDADSLRPAASQAGAPAAVSEQATGMATQAEKKSKSAAPMQRALNEAPADAVGSVISVRVNDIDASGRELEQTVKQLGGSIQKKDLPNAKRIYEISINAQKLQQLKEKLKRIGAVRDEAGQPVSKDGQIVLRIEFEVK